MRSNSQRTLLVDLPRSWLLAAVAGIPILACSCQAIRPVPPQPAPVTRASDPGVVRPVSYEEALPAAERTPASASPRVRVEDDAVAAPSLPNAAPSSPPMASGQPLVNGWPGCCPPATGTCSLPACGPPPGPLPCSPDEFICDGGDGTGRIHLSRDRRVFGLDQEDTVAIYQPFEEVYGTGPDGQPTRETRAQAGTCPPFCSQCFKTNTGPTHVTPSNRVCLYAPRFAAVRRVSGVLQHEQHERMAGVELPVSPQFSGHADVATTVLQPVEPRGQRSVRFGQTYRERTRTMGLENAQMPAVAEQELLPYEDFLALRRGELDNSEKARLAARLEAAIVWTHDLGVQVVIDNVQAVETSGTRRPQGIYTYDLLGKPRLCIAKCASTASAKPGDVVEFALRFENVGDQLVGNITILDNLSTRLEYVEGSETCSRKAAFSSSANEGESLVLRWDIQDPLPVGEGGVIRFQCRVR